MRDREREREGKRACVKREINFLEEREREREEKRERVYKITENVIEGLKFAIGKMILDIGVQVLTF